MSARIFVKQQFLRVKKDFGAHLFPPDHEGLNTTPHKKDLAGPLSSGIITIDLIWLSPTVLY
jgi:hypothetical protein